MRYLEEKGSGSLLHGALINNPVCLLADEPTGNLDNTTAHTIIHHLLSLKDTALIIVTHNLNIAHQMDRVLSLAKGYLKDITHQQ